MNKPIEEVLALPLRHRRMATEERHVDRVYDLIEDIKELAKEIEELEYRQSDNIKCELRLAECNLESALQLISGGLT